MVSVKPPSNLNILNKITKSAVMEKYLYKAARENPAKFAGTMALVSALSKDAVNCYYYTTQSWNNEKIPEDKRDFVGSMDLINGILNVGLQFTVGSWVKNNNEKWFNKLMGKHLDTNKTSEVAQKLETIIKKNDPKADISMEQIRNYLKTKKVLGINGAQMKWLKIGFSAFAVLIGTQIFTKRVLTPFFSPPIAGWFNKHVLDKKKSKKVNNDSKTKEQKQDKKPEMSDKELDALIYKPWEHSKMVETPSPTVDNLA